VYLAIYCLEAGKACHNSEKSSEQLDEVTNEVKHADNILKDFCIEITPRCKSASEFLVLSNEQLKAFLSPPEPVCNYQQETWGTCCRFSSKTKAF